MLTSIPKHPLFLIFSILIVFFLLLNVPIPVQAAGEIKVTVDSLNIRSGPGLEHSVITQVTKGSTYTVEDEKESWYQITVDGQQGWVASWLVEYKATGGHIKQAQSLVDRLNVREGPGTSFKLMTQIRPEQAFPVIQEEGEWLQIQLNDQKEGWVAKWLVEYIDQDASEATKLTNKAVVQATILNVRSKPDQNSSILGKLSQGQEIDILGVSQGWYKIKWNDSEGWIASDYVKQEEIKNTSDQQEPKDDKNSKNNETEDKQESINNPAKQQEQSSASEKAPQRYEVTASILNVRASGSQEAKIIGKLPQGTIIEKLEEKEDWLKISFEDGAGWVASWLVESMVQEPEQEQIKNQPKVTILNDGTNIRSGPSIQHSIVQRANEGEQFDIVNTEGDWFEIVLQNGQTAYIAGWIVSAEGVPSVHKDDLLDYLKGRKIVIDPGHGGKDSGATGSHFGTLEKVVNLQVAKLLQQKLSAAGANTVMTRTTDRFLTLQQRVDISILEETDVFLSIHHNTHTDKSINGLITYFYKSTDQKLAKPIQKELVKANGMKDLNTRQGNFFVLRENPKPSVLIELGFISNYNDELTVRQGHFQEKSTDGILVGVAKYFKEKAN